ncbi:ATP-binding protein [Streptomyces sp. URMC 123]|uniref:ATP-binding protein n=1 Tax=Streptomyces sp. URMC 123 TaxID=3423403 RepID=UPI003F1BCE66
MSRPRAGLRPRRPVWASTLRWEIAATITAVCCAVAAVLGVLVHNVVAHQTVEQVRKETRHILDDALNEFAYGSPPRDLDAELDPPELPAELRELVRRGERGTMVGHREGRAVMWAAAPAGDRVMGAWHGYGGVRASLNHLDTAILGSAALAAGTVSLAGFFLALRVSRRLTRTAEVARRISAGDLDARTGVRGRGAGRDEVADVAAALDSMAESLQERLRAEQRFTADVAHELRTPLSGLLASAGLLPEGRPKEMINDRLRALHRLTEDLLEISRLDAGVERAEPDAYELGPLVERAAAGTGLPAEVRVVRDAVVETDRRRLDRVLANLIVNAHRHGAPPVEVTVDAPVVEVRDHGPGFPEELLRHGPQRFRTRAPGRGGSHGLGLTIAAGQAQVLGVELRLENAESGGARAILRLPERGGRPTDPRGPQPTDPQGHRPADPQGHRPADPQGHRPADPRGRQPTEE